MAHKRFAVTILGLALAAPATYPQPVKETQMTDETNVVSAVLQMTDAFQRGDLPAVMARYGRKATVVFEPGSPVSDAAAIRERFAGAIKLNPQFDYGGHEAYVAGDIALHIAPWVMKATAPNGSPIEQRGLSVAVLQRQPDGQWLLVIDNPHGQRLSEAQKEE